MSELETIKKLIEDNRIIEAYELAKNIEPLEEDKPFLLDFILSTEIRFDKEVRGPEFLKAYFDLDLGTQNFTTVKDIRAKNLNLIQNSYLLLERLMLIYFHEGELVDAQEIFILYLNQLKKRKRMTRLEYLRGNYSDFFNWIRTLVPFNMSQNLLDLLILGLQEGTVDNRYSLNEKMFFKREWRVFHTLGVQGEEVDLAKGLIVVLLESPKECTTYLLCLLAAKQLKNKKLLKASVKILETYFLDSISSVRVNINQIVEASSSWQGQEKAEKSGPAQKKKEGTLTRIARGEKLLEFLNSKKNSLEKNDEDSFENSKELKFTIPDPDELVVQLYKQKIRPTPEEDSVLRVLFKDVEIRWNEKFSEHWQDLALMFLFMDSPGLGIRYLNKVFTDIKQNFSAAFLYLEFLIKDNRYREAVNLVDSIIDAKPLTSDQLTQVLYLKGEALFSLGLYSSAKGIYESIVRNFGPYRLANLRLSQIEEN